AGLPLAIALHVRAEPPAPAFDPASDITAAPPSAPPPPPSFSADELREAEARYAREPKAEDVVRAALRAAPAPRAAALAHLARLAAALAVRARLEGWTPRLSLRARRGTTVDLSAPQSLDSDTLRVRSNDGLTLEAALSFELDRVVFRREEVSLLHQTQIERDL